MSALELKEKGLSESIDKKDFLVGEGCEKCLNTGYLSRIGIAELLQNSVEIHDLILSHASPEKIKNTAIKLGFKDMIYDGLEKIFSGITTFEELLRVTKNV